MKKKILPLLMAALLSFASICFATDGKDLDYEQKIVDIFMAGKYSDAVKYMDPDMTKKFTEQQYNDMFASMTKEVGRLIDKEMVVFQKVDGGSILRYRAAFQNAVKMEIIAAFKNVDSKISLIDIMVLEPESFTDVTKSSDVIKTK